MVLLLLEVVSIGLLLYSRQQKRDEMELHGKHCSSCSCEMTDGSAQFQTGREKQHTLSGSSPGAVLREVT
jgi:hypothetical protein